MQSRSNKALYVLATLAVALFVGWYSNEALVRRASPPVSANDKELSLQFEGRDRTYFLHLPPAYNGQNSIPLVIVLHGGGGNSRSAARMTGFSAKADKEGFIVVYPDWTGILRDRLLTWNSGNCCGYALDNDVGDVGFIRTLIQELRKNLRIDSNRIFATGISNGGMMSYRLGCELSDEIAAIAPVAGALNVENCKPSNPVSVIAFHGTDDQNVLYEGGEPKKKADPHPRVDKSVTYSVSFWVQNNRCETIAQREGKGNIVVETYKGCQSGTAVTLYTIKGGGHAWPGGDRISPILDEPTREISATDIMWDFFAKHPKQQPLGYLGSHTLPTDFSWRERLWFYDEDADHALVRMADNVAVEQPEALVSRSNH